MFVFCCTSSSAFNSKLLVFCRYAVVVRPFRRLIAAKLNIIDFWYNGVIAATIGKSNWMRSTYPHICEYTLFLFFCCCVWTIIENYIDRWIGARNWTATTNSNESIYSNKSHWLLTNQSTEVVRLSWRTYDVLTAAFYFSFYALLVVDFYFLFGVLCLEYFILIGPCGFYSLKSVRTRLSAELTARPTTLTSKTI